MLNTSDQPPRRVPGPYGSSRALSSQRRALHTIRVHAREPAPPGPGLALAGMTGAGDHRPCREEQRRRCQESRAPHTQDSHKDPAAQ